MAKNVIKELIIVLIICFISIFALGVLLYEYVPTNQIIPKEISYVMPQAVKEQLKETETTEEEEVLLTYEIDQAVLNNYQRTNDYKPGKTNPFSTYETQTVENTSTNGDTNVSTSANIGTGTSTTSKTNNKVDENGSSSNNSTGTTTSTTKTTNSDTTQPGTVNPGNYTNNKGLK